MRELRLYNGFMPNEGSNDYYVFSSRLSYLEAIEPFRSETLSINNYRIDANASLRLAIAAGRQAITYCIETDAADASYFRAYKVVDVSAVSDMYIYALRLDYWATYYIRATFPIIRVKRCNLNIAQGDYDGVESVSVDAAGDTKLVKLEGLGEGLGYLTPSQVCVVVLANVVRAQSIDQSTLITSTEAFICFLSDIMAAYPTAYGQHNVVALASKFIAGIYKAGTSFWLDNKVEVVKAFLLPSSIAPVVDASRIITFTSKTEFENNADLNVQFSMLAPQRLVNPFSVPVGTLDINYKWYLGTFDGGLELERNTQAFNVFLSVYIDNDDVRVVVRQGDREKDISANFEIGITGNSRTADEGQRIARYTKALTSLFDVTLKASEAKSGSARLRLGIGAVNGAMNDYFARGGAPASPLLGAGDGAATFSARIGGTSRVNNPLYFVGYKSTANEQAKARVLGANFDLFIKNLNTLNTINYDMLGTLPTFERVYVQADAQVEDIPTAAQDEIRDALARGVYIKVV